MDRSPLTLAGFVTGAAVLWLAGPQAFAFAPPRGPETALPAKKPAAKSNKKKTQKQAVAKPPAKKKPVKVAAAPAKPAADIPLVTGAASVWRGCLESNNLPRQLESLASKLAMDQDRLGSLLEEQGLLADTNRECVPYVAATGGEGGVASAVFERTEVKPDESAILAVRKTADGVTVTPGACDCPESARRVLMLTASEATNPQSEALASVPENVRWQLSVLVPRMMAALQSEYDAADRYGVRIVVQQDANHEPENLHSVELLETASGKRIDGVWWLERSGSPGVLVGMEGTAYERLLWQSPVKYTKTSRGVGLSITTARRVIAPPKGGKGKPTVKTFKVREYHIGVDMLAPKGMAVHAVGDASVAFAGRMGGYGNLVILDHGLGYETYYAHLSSIRKNITLGTTVSRGDIIGLVGSTGHSTAPHLHFETRKDGKYIDPFDGTRQLEFWLLSADDQERLAMELLAPGSAADRSQKVARSGDAPAPPAD